MNGHLVVVTGGSAGLGRALLEAAPAGADRLDVSRRGCGLDGVRHLAADLADPDAWAVVGDEVATLVEERAWQRVTVIHNAGTLEPIGYAGEVDAAAYTANVLLNSAAPQVLGHRFLAGLRAAHGRRELVMISSGAARNPYSGWSSYGAGKAAIDQWVRSVGLEQADRGGVRVLSVVPGVVATAMQEAIRSADARDFPNVARFHRLHDEGQLVDPQDAARGLWGLLEDDVETGSVVDLRD